MLLGIPPAPGPELSPSPGPGGPPPPGPGEPPPPGPPAKELPTVTDTATAAAKAELESLQDEHGQLADNVLDLQQQTRRDTLGQKKIVAELQGQLAQVEASRLAQVTAVTTAMDSAAMSDDDSAAVRLLAQTALDTAAHVQHRDDAVAN